MSPKPLVSIGLPVYNGEDFLAQCLESLLAQTWPNIEIVVCDNASTDRTVEICRRFLKDPRVSLHCCDRNRGAAWNFNRSFQLSRGEYFKWTAHDDVCRPAFIEKCLAVLEAEPKAVLCYPREMDIDERGGLLGSRPYEFDGAGDGPAGRMAALMLVNRGSPPVFGLIRAGVLRQTLLIGPYDASDQVLLAELALRGRLVEVPEELQLHREHPRRSVRACPTRQAATAWFDTSKASRLVLPTLRLWREYWRAVSRSPVRGAERLRCYKQVLRWGRWHMPMMRQDLRAAVEQLGRRPGSRALPANQEPAK